MASPTSSDKLAQDTAEFHGALTSLIRVYQFRDRDRICCHDLSVTQWYALDSLVSGGPFTLNELAGELYLEKSTMSRVVDGLERKGYVVRNRHPDDGRAVLLEANSKGKMWVVIKRVPISEMVGATSPGSPTGQSVPVATL